jgi:hypothetical protein
VSGGIGLIAALLGAIIFAVAGFPLAARIVSSDSAFGLRSADTDGDSLIWHLANAEIGRDLLRTALLNLLIAVVALVYWGEDAIQSALVVVVIVLSIAGAIIALVHGISTARALGKAKQAFPPGYRRY